MITFCEVVAVSYCLLLFFFWTLTALDRADGRN